MPQHRNEPRIYSGKVIPMIGRDAGNPVPMDYSVAQAMVSSGQARWEDDPTPMPRQLAGEIAKREAERQAEIAADAAHFAALQNPPKSINEALVKGARPLYLGIFNEDHTFLAHPFPQIAEIDIDALNGSPVIAIDGKAIAVNLPNATAVYDIVAENDAYCLAELRESTEPAVEIPDDWRDAHFLKIMAIAKKIAGLDNAVSMKKDEATAILEQWTKSDDPVPEEPENPDEPRHGGRIIDGEHQDAEGGEAAKRSAEKEQEFVNEE